MNTRPEREETERDMWRWRLSERDKNEGKQGVAEAREALARGTKKESK